MARVDSTRRVPCLVHDPSETMNSTQQEYTTGQTPSQADLDQFFDLVLSRKFSRERYARIRRQDLLLNPFSFFMFCRFAFLANYRTRVANIAREKRQARAYRSKRTVNRTVSALAASGRIRALTRGTCFVARMGRPINVHVLHLAMDPLHALCVQFLLFLAFWRGDLTEVRTSSIQAALGVDRGLALHLGRWLRSRQSSLVRRKIRNAVFYCKTPYMGCKSWRHYCRTRGRRFGIVPPTVFSSLLSDIQVGSLTRTRGRSEKVPRSRSTERNVSLAGRYQTMPKKLGQILRDLCTPDQPVVVRSLSKVDCRQSGPASELAETVTKDHSALDLLTMYLPEKLKAKILKRRAYRQRETEILQKPKRSILTSAALHTGAQLEKGG